MANASSVIQFILDDKIVEIDFNKNDAPSPTTTVLKYLRSLQGHTGVKEGCSVGDCGACTVVLGELQNNKIHYRAITSCLAFLPALHGKQLITIENLAGEKDKSTELHPLQKHMIELHGTQCGYCTPGIIMSLFAMYKNIHHPTRDEIELALSGNLCRCTGYQPIIEAAEKACAGSTEDRFSKVESKTIEKLKLIRESNKCLALLSNDIKYYKAEKLNQALKLRQDFPEATIIAGSTDLSPQKNRFQTDYIKIIDISDIAELQTYDHDENNFYFGSGILLEDLRVLISKNFPPLFNILEVFGSVQIRNLATIGGNIASASPIGDLLPLLFIYNARIELCSLNNKRVLEISEFITAYRETALRTDEIISKIIIPKPKKDSIIKAYKISKRKDLDISTLSAAFKLNLNTKNITEEIMIVFGGMAEVPKRAVRTADFLIGKEWNREIIEEATSILNGEFNPISDVRSDAETRLLGAKNLLLKFWTESQ